MNLIDNVRKLIRRIMHIVARYLNKISGGHVSPNSITIIGLIAHILVAYLIATRHNLWAAGTLVIFGLFDTLDGELARLQKRASSAGMVLDASTDRMKEVLLYSGAAYAFIANGHPNMAVWAVAACGASLCVSYVKAKGEVAVKDSKLSANEINRLFGDGVLRFEIRMFLLVIGLLSNHLAWAVIIIAVGSTLTAFGRLIRITRKLSNAQN
ncbi:MAG: CDP-alcohol phosphatidyltransferase family protein [Candidatus Saccharimonadales bacterium]